MTIRNILVPVLQGVEFDTQLDAALQVARHVEAHVDAVFVRSNAALVAASIPEMLIAAGVTVEKIEDEWRAAEAAAAAKFEAWRAESDLVANPGDPPARIASAAWRARAGSVETVIVDAGRLADLIVLNRPDPLEIATERAFDAAVFDTGRPTLLVPRKLRGDLLNHIVVAWNSSIEATRAVAGAMPLLREAGRVSIFTAPRHADEVMRDLDLGEQLAWHGIRTRYLSPDADEPSVGAALLKAATDHSATLLVMGAYTHSRVREMLLGGVTRHIIRNAAIPVLMMH